MFWSKRKQCVVCGFYSYKGQKINKKFLCNSCEKDMIEDLAKEHEDQVWAELNRISNQKYDNRYYI